MRPREATKATCGLCGGTTARYLAHVRRCERASPESRAYFRDTGRWPPGVLPTRKLKGESQLPLF